MRCFHSTKLFFPSLCRVRWGSGRFVKNPRGIMTFQRTTTTCSLHSNRPGAPGVWNLVVIKYRKWKNSASYFLSAQNHKCMAWAYGVWVVSDIGRTISSVWFYSYEKLRRPRERWPLVKVIGWPARRKRTFVRSLISLCIRPIHKLAKLFA